MSFFGIGSPSGRSDANSSDAETLEASKDAVKKSLVNSVKEIQAEHLDDTHTAVIETNELSSGLMESLEALFIHGLKDGFSGVRRRRKLTSTVIEGVPSGPRRGSLAKLPQPNFWTYLITFSHKETLQRIEGLRQITSDVGRSRAWLRLAINEGLLSSYMSMMMKDRSSGARHYKRSALMRDPDALDVISRYVGGIEIYQFNLAINSGLLNQWQPHPLVISGMMAPLPEDPPVTVTAVDAAECLDEEGFDPVAVKRNNSKMDLEAIQKEADKGRDQPIQYIKDGLVNEDEALKMILRRSRTARSSGSPSPASIGSPLSRSGSLKKFQGRVPDSSGPRSLPLSSSSKGNKSLAETTNPAIIGSLPNPSQPDEVDNSSKSRSEESKENTPPPCEEGSNLNLDDNNFTKKPSKDLKDSLLDEDDENDESIYSGNYLSKSLENQTQTPILATTFFPRVPIGDKILKSSDKVKPCDEMTTNDEGDFVNVVPKQEDLSNSRTFSFSIGGQSNKQIPCLSGFIDSWNPFGTDRYFDTPPKFAADGDESNSPTKAGFTFKKDAHVPGLSIFDSQRFLEIFDKIAVNQGLDVQDYECVECTRAIGTIFGPAKECNYTKKYFCETCHSDDTSVIPARVVNNWDFKQYKVSKKAKMFLRAMCVEPIIDSSKLNPATINFAKELKEAMNLRKQLKFMNAYLSTCASRQQPRPKNVFVRILQPRKYLYKEPNMYSISDLEDAKSGKLRAILSEAVKFSKHHILKECLLCAGRGFFCELCGKGAPLYPFDFELITQCEKCFAVFHKDCSKNVSSCPKCDRLEARNLNWHVSSSMSQRSATESAYSTIEKVEVPLPEE